MSCSEKEQVKIFVKMEVFMVSQAVGHCTLQHLGFCLVLTISVGICLLCLVGM